MDGVFVYGTLLSGFEPHRAFSKGLKKASPGFVTGYAMVHLPQGYPAVFEAPDSRVHGELLEFDDLPATLQRLDIYEVCDPDDPDSLYRRLKVEVQMSERRALAWCYVYSANSLAAALDAGGVRVDGGDWRRFLQER